MAVVRCAEYGRISDKIRQENNYSLETQLEGMEKRRSEKGYTLNPKHVYVDKKSGLTWRRREELQKMLDGARRHEFDVLLVYDLDRFSRDPDHQIIVMEELAYNGVRVECMLRDIDTTPAGKLMLYILGYSANLESKRFAERADRGRRKRAAKGRLIVGRRPKYGYTWIDIEEYNEEKRKTKIRTKARYILKGEVVKVEADGTEWTEPKVVCYIFSLYVDLRWSLRKIAGHLTEKGIPSPDGNDQWYVPTIRNIIACSDYISQGSAYKLEVTKTPDEKIHRNVRPVEEQYLLPEETIPPILITEDGTPDVVKFEKAQQLLVRNRVESKRNNPNPEATLLRAGMAVCAYCGANLTAQRRIRYDIDSVPDGYERIDYVCPGKRMLPKKCQGVQIKAQTLDAMFWKKAVEIIRDPHEVEEKIALLRTEDPTKHDLRATKKELANVEEEIKTYDYAIKEAIKKRQGQQAINHYSSLLALALGRKTNLEGQVAEVKVDQSKWQELERKLDEFKAECERLRGQLDTPGFEPTYQFKRDACVFFGLKATVYKPPKPKKPQPVRIESNPPDIVSTSTSSLYSCRCSS